MNSEIHALTSKTRLSTRLGVQLQAFRILRRNLLLLRALPAISRHASVHGRRINKPDGKQPKKPNERKNSMIATFQVHKQTYGHWPAKNGKPAGESFDLDLIDMSIPAEHAYRGTLPYRLSPEEKEKYWGKIERRNIQVAVHEIQTTQRGPVLRGVIISVNEK